MDEGISFKRLTHEDFRIKFVVKTSYYLDDVIITTISWTVKAYLTPDSRVNFSSETDVITLCEGRK